MKEDTRNWIQQDHTHAWHPFTDQSAWTSGQTDPLIITKGEGIYLEDSEGKRYIDGNSSIWTNIHGHAHPAINAAITEQLGKISHSSYLGFGNPRASELAERLSGFFPSGTLERVFFSDDGSTAIEAALKMALQYRRQSGEPARQGIIAFENSYHGDTLGAASTSGVSKFVSHAERIGYPVQRVASLEILQSLSPTEVEEIAAVIIEPIIQGVNEMRLWPTGMLRKLRHWCDENDVHLILDEVMTGFGRTGTMFACQQEAVIPDFLCLAKGLTGGYLPLAATLTSAKIYEAFHGSENAFYYGHSFTGNQLGCAAALANLDLFETEQTLKSMPVEIFRSELDKLTHPRNPCASHIKEIRQIGLIAGIELQGVSAQEICLKARKYGLLTRPINETIVLMPPLSINNKEIVKMVDVVFKCLP